MTYAPDLIHIASAGESIAERHALLNNCTHIFILRNDFRQWDAPNRWEIHANTSEHFPGGFKKGGFNSRKEAIDFCESTYPNLGLSFQHGETVRLARGMSGRLSRAIHESRAIRGAA